MNKQPISIEPLEAGDFNIRVGDRYAEGLTFDEALGCAARIMLADATRPTWLRTAEAHASDPQVGKRRDDACRKFLAGIGTANIEAAIGHFGGDVKSRLAFLLGVLEHAESEWAS